MQIPLMETNPPPAMSSSSSSLTLNENVVPISPNANGYLCLYGNPGPWIANTPPSSHLKVKHLVLDYSGGWGMKNETEHKIDESIDKLTQLTHLTITRANNSLNSLPYSISNLRNLQHLEFNWCNFQQLPANIGSLKTNLTHLTLSNLACLNIKHCRYLTELPACLGQLRSLKHFSLHECTKLLSLPNNMSSLLNLQTLSVENCCSLTELPAGLGQLRSLKHFSLHECLKIISLPNNISSLLNLKTLSVENCCSFINIPVNLKVTYLRLICCPRTPFIPRGLINLCHLEVTPRFCSETSFANLKDSVNLHHLTLVCWPSIEILKAFPNFKQLVNLSILSFRGWSNHIFIELWNKLKGMDEVIILDIVDTNITYLPWSITRLNKLRFLVLPSNFRLETLPFRLNDSVLISVKGKHVRKTWKQFKQDIGVSDFPIPQYQYWQFHSTVAPPGYLCFPYLGSWVWKNSEPCLQVKMLDLELSSFDEVQDIKNSIGEFSYLTHLFVTNGHKTNCLPRTINGLKHLCLDSCSSKFYSFSLRNLSNLESLDMIKTTFTTNPTPNLPFSLRRLSLQSLDICSLPSSMASLPNLNTLELGGCYNLTSLSQLNIVTLKIDRIIESLPIGLRHLEIFHVKSGYFDKSGDIYCDCDMLEHCLTNLVNLEVLSLTCHRIKSLPRMARQRNLRVLLLRDCFSLKELLPDVEQLVELNTLDISGTRIKSLPHSIIKLSKLQQLTLPKCFTQKLPRGLEEVSIIDETDKRYYEHMGYYDSSYQGNDDDEVGSVEEVDEAITENPIQIVNDEEQCAKYDVIAQALMGSMSTYRCRKRECGTSPSSKMRKHCSVTKDWEQISDSPALAKPSKLAGNEQTVTNGAAATMATVEKLPLEFVREGLMEFPEQVEVHLDGENTSNIAQPNEISSSFDFMKACYMGDQVWIDCSLASNFDQLNELVRKKFTLEVNKFKIKYLDEDNEWSLLTCISDLMHALLHTSSSGRRFVRLSIVDKGYK